MERNALARPTRGNPSPPRTLGPTRLAILGFPGRRLVVDDAIAAGTLGEVVLPHELLERHGGQHHVARAARAVGRVSNGRAPAFQDPLRFPMVSLPLSIRGNTHISLFKLPMENIHEFSEKNIEIVSIVFDEENSIVKIERYKKDFSNLPERNMYYASLTSLHPGKYKC